MNPNEMVGKTITVSNTPAFAHVSGSADGTLVEISGTFVVTSFDSLAEQFYLVTEEDNEMLKSLDDDDDCPPFYMYYVDMGYIEPTEEMIQEVDSLEKQFNIPSVEHPLGPHTGHITNMEDNTKTGADILNTPSETPRFDVPFEQPEEAPVEGEYTDEEYASVPSEINDKVIKVIREMRAAGTPMPEIMRHAREIIEAYIDSNRRVAYTEGGNWYHDDEGNWCENCVNEGKAPGDVKPVGPLAENVQIACSGCNEEEGTLNREFGRNLIEKMPQYPKLPGVGTIPIPLDVVKRPKQAPRRPDEEERKEFHGASVEVERTTMPSEHLGWYEKTANELESSYYTLRLTGEQVATIKGGLRALVGQLGPDSPEGEQITSALEAIETAEYDVSGSGLGDIPTLPDEPER